MVVFDFCTVFISHGKHPHLSIRECRGNDEYLEDKRKGYQNCFIMSHGDMYIHKFCSQRVIYRCFRFTLNYVDYILRGSL